MEGTNWEVIFCCQILLIKYIIYLGLSADLGILFILSAPRETRVPTLQVPFVSVWPMFRASAGAFASIFIVFLIFDVTRYAENVGETDFV